MEEAEVLGYTSIIAGLAIALLAGRLPMNTLVGFRAGPAFMSRRIWTRANRMTGIGLAAAGVLALAAGPRLGPYTIPLYIATVLVVYAAILAWAWGEASREASMKPPAPGGARPLEPINPGTARVLASLVLAVSPLPVVGPGLEALVHMVPGLVSLILCIVARYVPVLFYNPWLPPSDMFRVLHEIALLAGVVAVLSLPGSPVRSDIGPVGLVVGLYAIARMALVMARPRLRGGS